MGVCNCSMFCCTLLYVHSSIAIILMGKRELVVLLNLSSWCLVMVERLFLAVPRGCLQFVIVVFPDHTHLLFFIDYSLMWALNPESITFEGSRILGPTCSSVGKIATDTEECKATCSFVVEYMNLPQSFPVIGETKAEWPTKGKLPLPPLDPLAVSSILDPLY